jgi:hypothetical protein
MVTLGTIHDKRNMRDLKLWCSHCNSNNHFKILYHSQRSRIPQRGFVAIYVCEKCNLEREIDLEA